MQSIDAVGIAGYLRPCIIYETSSMIVPIGRRYQTTMSDTPFTPRPGPDPTALRGRAAPGGGRPAAVLHRPERLPAGGLHPLAGCRADELLAARLRPRPARHRDHRGGRAGRTGLRRRLVGLEAAG